MNHLYRHRSSIAGVVASRHAVASKSRSCSLLHLPPRTRIRRLNSSSSPADKKGGAANVIAPSKSAESSSSASSRSSSSSTPSSSPASGRDDASLARYPNLHTAGGLLRLLDYAGTITFASMGSVTAAQSGLDVFGCAMAAVITAVGGGTIRDAVFLNRRPFWTEETEYVWMGLFTGLATFFAWPEVLRWQEKRKGEIFASRRSSADDDRDCVSTIVASDRGTTGGDDVVTSKEDIYDNLDATLDTLDAIGLSSFAIIGAQNGVRACMPPLVSAICGMATSTFGGMTRDVLCGRPVRIVHSNAEVYAVPALMGATAYLAALGAGAGPGTRIGLAMATCMGSRFVAVKNDVKLHTWDTTQDNLGVAVRKRPTVKPAMQ